MYSIVIAKFKPENLVDLSLNELNQVAISELGCLGIEEFSMEEGEVDEMLGERAFSGGDIPESLLDEVNTKQMDRQEIVFKYYFNESENQRFCVLLNDHEISYEVVEGADQDWSTHWRKTYTPVKITEELWIIPEWMKEEYPGKENLYIYPGQGFGTGKHETTALCLELMMSLKGQHLESCLDLGCGSGILGIAYLKFWDGPTVFCDIDKAALSNSLQNLELNYSKRDLSHCRLILRERQKADEKFQLVFANILLSALIEEKSFIKSTLHTGAHLIVSGLLNEQVDELKEIYCRDLALTCSRVVSRGDWSAIHFIKA